MKKVDYDRNQYKNYQQGRAHSAETILQKIDNSLQAYYQRIKIRSYSTFEFMSDEEFQAGLLAMKKAVNNEKAPSPVTEAIDLLVFKKC